jgi:hypothetical protein
MNGERGQIEVVVSEDGPLACRYPFDKEGHLSFAAIIAFADRDSEYMSRQGDVTAKHLEGCKNCQKDLKEVSRGLLPLN